MRIKRTKMPLTFTQRIENWIIKSIHRGGQNHYNNDKDVTFSDPMQDI